ncbi:hypothetical protein F5148DRAFT_340325 [Russula earlei]|uniref:Uncharacterized protein n=1 Tax=Russula earlei TaxID=71964 RepID=A0ACC0U1E7_9AGAM|nr:hypothetical protein F5148DRAFT_340325 [Russula earlei]
MPLGALWNPVKLSLTCRPFSQMEATPTLQDLERLKPSEHSDPQSKKKKYAHEYSALLDKICRSFSHDQLRTFSHQYGLQIGSKRRKMAVAEAIVEKAWRWPPFRELNRGQRDRTEVASQTLKITSSELFILLGKDGSDLFQLSKKYNVHISVKPNPLSIYLEGSREAVRAMENYVGSVRKGIVEDTVDTPFTQPLSKEALQKISRLSGAFVEDIGNQKLRVRAKRPTNIMLAQRLAIRVYYQTEPSELLAQQIHNTELHTPTTAPLAYALYPFSVPRSLPPMMKSNTFYRWRRAGDWLGDTHSQIGLGPSLNSIFTMDGTEARLQHRLMGNTTIPGCGSRRVISVSSGHIIFSFPRSDTGSSLLAPYTGRSTYSDTRSWLSAQRSSATFIPSLPLGLVKALPSKQSVLNRLVYRCLQVNEQDPIVTHHIRLEVPLVDLKQVRLPVDLPERSVFEGAMFWSGSSTNLDILMPDRQMDLRFNVSDMNPLVSGQRPGELLNYLNELEIFLTSSDPDVAQPIPPLRVFYDDRDYVLVTNTSVRRSTETLSSDTSPEIAVTSESTLDLESGHNSAVCVISSDKLDSPVEWNAFLQQCDQMTARTSLRSSEL